MSTTTLLKVEITAATTSATTAEEICEYVIHVHIIEASTLTVALLVLSDAFLSLLVVDSTLIRVGKSLVGIGNLLKCLFGCFRVILVLVRVILDCELLESFFDLIFSRVSFHAHHLVVVFSFRLLFSLLLLVMPLSTTALLIIMTMLSMDQCACRSVFPATGDYDHDKSKQKLELLAC